MMPIDKFINQLIHQGLADSFLDVIELHYLKVVEIYNMLSCIDEENIINVDCTVNNQEDSMTVTIEMYNPVELDYDNIDSSEFLIQIINNGTLLEITIVNKYESEAVIYENRFNGRRTPYTHKWS
jgi:hypothetical protein